MKQSKGTSSSTIKKQNLGSYTHKNEYNSEDDTSNDKQGIAPVTANINDDNTQDSIHSEHESEEGDNNNSNEEDDEKEVVLVQERNALSREYHEIQCFLSDHYNYANLSTWHELGQLMDHEERCLLEGASEEENWNFLYRPNVIFVSINVIIFM